MGEDIARSVVTVRKFRREQKVPSGKKLDEQTNVKAIAFEKNILVSASVAWLLIAVAKYKTQLVTTAVMSNFTSQVDISDTMLMVAVAT